MAEDLSRRWIGASSARSALLTVLGEYVAPRRREVPRPALVSALEALGFGTSAARQAVARSVEAGWLHNRRVGRSSALSLSGETQSMLRAGYPRIYEFGKPWEWDGRWLVVVVRVPEERREIRDRTRTRLAWAGFGALGGGVWISPHLDRATEAREAAAGAATLLAFVGEQVDGLGTSNGVVAQAWDLESIAALYRAFCNEFRPARPRRPSEVFAAQTAIVHRWRKFPLIDPDLPRELLPRGWPKDAARRLFSARHGRWHDGAEQFFASLAD